MLNEFSLEKLEGLKDFSVVTAKTMPVPPDWWYLNEKYAQDKPLSLSPPSLRANLSRGKKEEEK